jgi:hypothetical protein
VAIEKSTYGDKLREYSNVSPAIATSADWRLSRHISGGTIPASRLFAVMPDRCGRVGAARRCACQPVAVDWRSRDVEGTLSIIDLLIDGVSLRINADMEVCCAACRHRAARTDRGR